MKKRILGAVAMAAAGLMVLAGCSQGGSGGGNGDDSGPIVIGSVNTNSGKATFPEAHQAAQAVFNKFNKDGGLDGRKIKYITKDDQGDLSKASTLGKEIVNDDDAVAMVGGASLIQCQANADFFKAKGIISIPGIGVDRNCFESENVAPANVGPFNDTTLTLMYGSEVLGLDHICALLEIAGNTLPAYQAAIKKWEKVTGKKLFYEDHTVPYGASDYTSYLVKAKNKGCQAIMNNPVEPDSIAMLKNAHAMGWSDVTWLELTSVYSTNYSNSISHTGKGLYVPAEFYPFTQDNKQTHEWRALMKDDNIKLTAFSQGGFLAAKHFIKILQDMDKKGIDITRDNITDYVQHKMKKIDNPMIGTPYTFGTAKTHHANTCGWPVQLMSGTNKWELADKGGDKWLCIPKS